MLRDRGGNERVVHGSARDSMLRQRHDELPIRLRTKAQERTIGTGTEESSHDVSSCAMRWG